MTSIIQTTAAVALSAICIGQLFAQQKQQAVSIVFTDQSELRSVDTIIQAGDQALDQLLSLHELSKEDIHLIKMDNYLPWTEAEGEERKEIVVIQTEDIEDGQEPRRMEMIRVNGESKDMSELSDEERELIEKELVMRKRMTEDKKGNNKRIEIRKEDDAKDKDVRIEVTNENGVEEINVWVNGDKLSDEEAIEFLEKNEDAQVLTSEEAEFMFISEDEEVQDGNMRIRKEIKVETSAEAKRAVVIVKGIKTTGKKEIKKTNSGDFSIYPNPARDKVNVQFSGDVKGLYELNISTLDGKVLLVEQGEGSGAIKHTMDLSKLAAGTYIVTLSHKAGISAEKLIVK